MFARLANRSGVQGLHAHLCGYMFATRLLINGGDVLTLQQILGHTTLEMVRALYHSCLQLVPKGRVPRALPVGIQEICPKGLSVYCYSSAA